MKTLQLKARNSVLRSLLLADPWIPAAQYPWWHQIGSSRRTYKSTAGKW